MGSYQPRHIDASLQRALRTAGAVHVQGPRGCGKTRSAARWASTAISLDSDSPEAHLAAMQPSSALDGEPPRLIDEWQIVPDVWNAVRHEVDRRGLKGQFILTGSSWPEDDSRRHSGAGRFSTVTMRTATWAERGLSTGDVSLASLVHGEDLPTSTRNADVATVAQWLCHGGFPSTFADDVDVASDLASSYIDDIVHRDLVGTERRRDPVRFRRFLTAYAGLSAHATPLSAVRNRMGEDDGPALHAETVSAYHDLATRMFLIEDQPAWSTALRSKGSLTKLPKRHLADTALVCALLGASPERLHAEPTFLGHLFESQVTHDLRVYADVHRMRGVFHLRDAKGRREIDVVVEDRTGSWVGIEVKLSIGAVDDAAARLLSVASDVRSSPAALAVVVPSGKVVRRDDGVWVVPATALGP